MLYGRDTPPDLRALLRSIFLFVLLGDNRMFSGCMDSQTSADVHDVSKFGLPNADGAGGACTNAMLLNLVGLGLKCNGACVGS